MSIQIRPATAEDVPAIKEFNRRLETGNAGFQFPETPRALGVPREDGAPVWHELFVATDAGQVRAGFALKRELLSMESALQSVEIWNYQIPLSEGVVNKVYATLGIRLLQDAIIRQSRLYCLGMGSLTRPLPRLLQRFSFTVEEVPFRFLVLRASGFLSNIEFLRSNPKRRMLLNVARFTGMGAIGVASWRLLGAVRKQPLPSGLAVTEVRTFGREADHVFEQTRSNYGAVIDRSAAALNVRFPLIDERLVRISVTLNGQNIGWVVISHSQCHSHKQFGNMRLGCIVDGMCDPAKAEILVGVAVKRLRDLKVDLIVSNQTHHAWLDALKKNGFLAGPSNFIFARSPALANETPSMENWHINRGDGDGPINL